MSTSTETAGAAAAPEPGRLLRGLGFLLITATLWGLNWPVMKFMLTQLPPLTSRACPALAGAALALIVARARRERLWPTRREWRRLAVIGVLNFTSFMGFAALSMRWLSASEAAIIAYTLPIWAALLAWPVLGERPTPGRVLGLLVGMSGVFILLAGEGLGISIGKLPGVACALGTAVMFALGTVLTKRAPLAVPPLTGLGWQIAVGSVPLVLGAALFEHPDFAAVTRFGWALIGYGAVLSLGLAYLAWFRALRLLPASLAATAILIVPVIGVFSAALLLGEPLGIRQLGALALTLGGVGLAVRG